MTTTQEAINRTKWQDAYDQFSPQERADILSRMERNKLADLEYYKKMPLALDGLPVSKLLDIVEMVLNDTHDLIVTNHPDLKEKMSAYECLAVFYMEQGEKSERDMRDAIEAICKAWGVSQFPEVETKQAVKARVLANSPI